MPIMLGGTHELFPTNRAGKSIFECDKLSNQDIIRNKD
jgi:hypothetical protein